MLDREAALRAARWHVAAGVVLTNTGRAGPAERGAVAGACRVEQQVVRAIRSCALRQKQPGGLRRQVREPSVRVRAADRRASRLGLPPDQARIGRLSEARMSMIARARRAHRADPVGHVGLEHGDEAGDRLPRSPRTRGRRRPGSIAAGPPAALSILTASAARDVTSGAAARPVRAATPTHSGPGSKRAKPVGLGSADGLIVRAGSVVDVLSRWRLGGRGCRRRHPFGRRRNDRRRRRARRDGRRARRR